MARHTYTPSQNEMSSIHVDRAAKEGRPQTVISDPATQANQINLSKDDPAEQRRAALTVVDRAATHPCQLDPKRGITTCDHPFHADDVRQLHDLLDAFGLVPEADGPNETWLSANQAARILGISEAAVRSRVKKGRLRSAVIGRQRSLRIDPDQVRRIAEATDPEGDL